MTAIKFKQSYSQSGQSLIEVLIALAIFILGIAAIGFLIIDANISGRQGIERTKAILLSREGIEASRSIRDNDFDDLVSGTHGIAIQGNTWVFSGNSDTEDQFVRTVEITDIDIDTKKIKSTVSWQFTESRPNSVTMTDYLTDWNQTQGQAGYLNVDVSAALLGGQHRLLQGIRIQNAGPIPITIDKMTVSWDNAVLIEDIAIQSNIVWSWDAIGTPSGRQPSGTELNISDYTLNAGSGLISMDEFRFNQSIANANFILKFIMNDRSTKYAGLKTASAPEWQVPVLAGVYNTPSTADGNDVFVLNNFAYLATNGTNQDFHVINVTNHAIPTFISSLELNAGANRVEVSGNYAYVASTHNDEELQIVNISDPSRPTKIGVYNKQGNADGTGIALSGNMAYLVTNNVTGNPGYDFYALNVANPSSPSFIGGLDIGNAVKGIAVSGSYAFIATANNNGEFQIIGISNPASPSRIAFLNLPGTSGALSIFVSGSYAFIGKESTSGAAEFFVINIAVPAFPTIIGQFEVGASINDIFVDGTRAFLATNDPNYEFQVLDIATPSSPVKIGTYNTVAEAKGIYVSNNTAYLATTANNQELVILEPN